MNCKYIYKISGEPNYVKVIVIIRFGSSSSRNLTTITIITIKTSKTNPKKVENFFK